MKNINSSLKSDSTIIGKDIDSFFTARGMLVTQMTTNPKIIALANEVKAKNEVKTNSNYSDVVKSLQSIKKTDSNISLVYVALEKASYLVSNDEWDSSNWDISKRQWYWDTIKAGKLFYTAPYVDQVTGKMVVTIAFPILDNNGKSVGAVGIDLMIDQLPSIMKNYKVGDSGYAFLVDRDGLILYHPDDKKILKENVAKLDGKLGEIGKKMINNETGTDTYTADKTDNYIAYSPIKSNGWSVATVISKSEVEAPLVGFNRILLLIYSVGLAVIILVIYFVVKQILKHIPTLLLGIRKITEGDLTSRVDVKSNDEIGEIANAFNDMTKNLQNLIEKISTNSQNVSASGEELAATISEVNKQIQTINAGTQEIAAAMEETSASTEEMNSSGSIIKNAVVNLNQKSMDGTASSIEIKNRALNMKEESEQSKNKAVAIYKEKQLSILKAIEQGKVVEEINSMASIIGNIAEQTNLLALNASIEAARAGEQGKGFAVVAGEVGKLADQSAQTVSNIQKIVGEVKNAFENISQNATGVLDFIDKNVLLDYNQMIERANLSLKDSENLAELITDFSKNIGEVSTSVEQLIKSIESVSTVVEEVAANASEIAGTINDTKSATDNVAQVADDQANLAQELNSMINQFKV